MARRRVPRWPPRKQANDAVVLLQLTREYNLKCVYLFYPVLRQHIEYEFEPCDNDPTSTVTAEGGAAAGTLAKEARRYANRIARENKNIRECTHKLQVLQQLKDQDKKVRHHERWISIRIL